MEWINVIVTAICSLLAAVGGGTVMFYKQNRKLKDAEVIHTQADEWKRLYDESESERKGLSEKVDKLYKEQHELSRKVLTLEVEVKRLLPYTCTKLDCVQRQQCSNIDDD